MLAKPHFRNGLKCHPVHDHGASCAVDVLLDSFYFGMYEYTKNLGSPNYDRTNGMVQRLEAVCHFRDVFESASCDLREEMWEWCVKNLPKAYSPKGRGDAEVLEAFVAFADNSNCTVKIRTEAICHKCTHNTSTMSSVAVVSITSPVNVKCSGYLGKSVEMQISQYARTRFIPCTAHPNADMDGKLLDVSWPDILVVELGIVDSLNKQSPPAKIEQCMAVGNCTYELMASVQAEPGHFYCIARIGNQYAVIDGLKDVISLFNTFTGAVHKDNTLIQDMHSTTTTHHAIHILIFQKRLTGSYNKPIAHACHSQITVDTECTTQSDTVSVPDVMSIPDDSNMPPGSDNKPITHAGHSQITVDTKGTVPDNSIPFDSNMPPGSDNKPITHAGHSQITVDTKGTVPDMSIPVDSNMPPGSDNKPITHAGHSQITVDTKGTVPDNSIPFDSNMPPGSDNKPITHAGHSQITVDTKGTVPDMSIPVDSNMPPGSDNKPITHAGHSQITVNTKGTVQDMSIPVDSDMPPGSDKPITRLCKPQSCVTEICKPHKANSSPHPTSQFNHPDGRHVSIPHSDKYINLGVGLVKVVEESGHIFALCTEVFHCAGMTSHVKKNGYKVVDQVVCKAGLEPDKCFLLCGNRRQYIREDALSALLHSRIGNSTNKTQMIAKLKKTCDERQFVDQSSEEQKMSSQKVPSDVYYNKLKNVEKVVKAGGATMFTGHVSLSSGKVRYATRDKVIYLCCKDIFQLCGMAKHLKHVGYSNLDRQLNKLGLSDVFVLSGRQRILIQLTSLLELLNDGLSSSSLSADNIDKIRKELVSVMQSETCLDIMKRRCMVTPKKNKLTSPISVNRSPMTMLRKKKHRTLFPSIRIRKNNLKHKTEQLKSAMKAMYQSIFKNKSDFIRTFAKLISTDKKVVHDDDFDGSFTASCITQILKMVDYKSSARSRCTNFLDQLASESSNISAPDIIYLEENFSGTRLMEQLRLKLPTILPPQREERALKKKYNSQFKAILLPQRTPTGWCVNPERLMELLSFKYWWLQEEMHWKVYGDGRSIGGRQSCFIALSTLNNEARLHGISHQSPKEIYPVYVFYESDSRDNIEENLGFPSQLDAFIRKKQLTNNIFYLSGDEMFLEAMLASEGLGPLTYNGWNIYRSDGTEQKEQTSPSTGMRTDLNLGIDRDHPESILSSIPTSRVVLCILHALARSVEKLINLEVDNILSDGNKAGQRGQDSAAFVEEKVHNLQNNINKRGVRGGQFHIYFNSKGVPEPVKLNKTHAMVIISCPPVGYETDYPHVLTHVLNDQKRLVNPISDALQMKLGLEKKYTEFELVKSIWDHFNKMITIVQKDTEPELLIGRPEDSLRVDDYCYLRYSVEDRKLYVHHAESFYQLYVWRYTCKALTPYMIKLIDIVPVFMKTLPFPVARFESEGGENLNNEHGRFYYQHTTRHGGKDKPDPLLSLFRNMFNRLAYTIGHGDTPMDKEARSNFNTYCRQHEAAAIIQRSFRVFLGRNQDNVSRPTVATTGCQPGQLFSGFTFVLCGNVPKHGSKKYTQAAFKALIHENGGRVRTKLPGEGKGVSTKRYTVIASPNMLQHSKIVGPIRQAVRKGFDVLKYAFVTESIDAGKLADPQFHAIDVTQLLLTVTKNRSLQDRHFSKSVSLLTQLKKQRKKQHSKLKRRAIKKKPVRSAALHYALKRRRDIQHGKHVTFWQSRNTLLASFKEWSTLPLSEKAKATEEWQQAWKKT